ncbi:hypothetical protein EDC04DRAFT_2598141 [Pisolithus marmoratus]|nr:hypothetical protein EDC04DRAFT_2598141 [Pisolithus marmoratus]
MLAWPTLSRFIPANVLNIEDPKDFVLVEYTQQAEAAFNAANWRISMDDPHYLDYILYCVKQYPEPLKLQLMKHTCQFLKCYDLSQLWCHKWKTSDICTGEEADNSGTEDSDEDVLNTSSNSFNSEALETSVQIVESLVLGKDNEKKNQKWGAMKMAMPLSGFEILPIHYKPTMNSIKPNSGYWWQKDNVSVDYNY